MTINPPQPDVNLIGKRLKAVLAVNLNELIQSRGLSQTEAAAITGMTQPKPRPGSVPSFGARLPPGDE